MRRDRRPSLRGSVQQSTGTVRVRARETSRLTFLIRASIAVAVAMCLLLGLIWSWHSGWIHRETAEMNDKILHLTQRAHFAVNDIVVEGRKHTDKDLLFVALEAPAKSPILAFNPAEAEARIAKLSWVKAVTVERRLPDTLYVRLTERTPLARWQRDNRISVIDDEGKTLPDANSDSFGQLPLIVGAGAPDEAKEFLEKLHNFPSIEPKVQASVRVGERRWDIHLTDKIVARLPENNLAEALKRLSILITEQKILERDIVAIDLRIPDRLIIESGSTAPTAHPTDNRL